MMEIADLTNALSKKAGYEAVNTKSQPNQLRFLGRVPQPLLPTWLLLVQRLLEASVGAPWSVDISKQYFMRGDKLVFGWRIILQGEAVETHLGTVVTIIKNVQRVSNQLDEVPLYSRPNRNSLSGTGKGAQPTESAVVGPLAMRGMRG